MKLRNVTGVFLAGLVALLLPVTVSQVRAQGQAASGAVTPSGSLVVGDAAPPITIETWLKGTPVPVLKKGETYVVEFWATWCGPCRQSIPHLTELQAKFKEKNVTIIGISSGERKGLEDVKPFVENMGDKMNYTIAYDKGRTTFAAWMAAAGQNGIPTAFVVNPQGQVAWIGHPVYPKGELDRVIEEVAAGRYDVKAEVERAAKVKDAQTRLGKAAAASDTAGVLAGLDELMAVDPLRYDEYAVKKMNILLFLIKDYDAGYALAGKLVDGSLKDEPQFLNGLAWTILDDASVAKRDYDLAFRAASRANELTAGKDPVILNTLARAHFEKGDVAKAVEYQTTAVSLVQDENQKKDLTARLEKYQGALKN